MGEVSLEMETESGMINRILTERYKTYSEAHRQNLITAVKQNKK